MKTITINNNGTVTINGEICLSQWEIADIFEVYVSTINSNIRSIIKAGIVRVNIQQGATQFGNTIIPDLYDMEMIIALAFRINSPKAEIFRNWVVKKAHRQAVVVQMDSIYLN